MINFFFRKIIKSTANKDCIEAALCLDDVKKGMKNRKGEMTQSDRINEEKDRYMREGVERKGKERSFNGDKGTTKR